MGHTYQFLYLDMLVVTDVVEIVKAVEEIKIDTRVAFVLAEPGTLWLERKRRPYQGFRAAW